MCKKIKLNGRAENRKIIENVLVIAIGDDIVLLTSHNHFNKSTFDAFEDIDRFLMSHAM